MPRGQQDELTGALDRRALNAGLEELTAAAERFAVAMLDVDHLKTVNDVYGHAAGDIAISTVVQRTRHALRNTDRIYRYGGDEFVILLPGTGHAEAAAVLRRVREHVIQTPIDAGHSLNITVSIGVAGSDEQQDSSAADTLLRADERLYRAKRAGRNSMVSDDRAGNEPGGGLAETRLFGRDAQLATASNFLAAQPETAEQRVLQITGPAGVGLSRFMKELGIRAGLAGRAVRQLELNSTHRHLHLRALELAYHAEISADASVNALAARLRSDAERHGLVILLEGGVHLDPASRHLLEERLARTGTWLVEAVTVGEDSAFTASERLELKPLTRSQTLDWLGAATVGPIEVMTGNALFAATGGLPGRLERLSRQLLAAGELKRTPVGLTGDPELIRERARQLEQAPEGPRLNLPLWDTPLVGRNRLLELIRSPAAAARLVVVTGPGGIGKSRLAAQLALELSDRAPDGTDWLDLRAVTSVSHLPRMLAASLGLEPFDELERVTEQLTGQQRLLLVDEADGISDAAGVFGELLRQAPGLRLIVTSRMPLRLPEEKVIEVPELPGPAAQELFRQGMRRQRATDTPAEPQITELLERIGFSPLSIELAAAWTRVFTVGELTRALDEQPELLVDAPGLQPRTQRFIDVTRQLLSEAEQETLGTLALVPAGFTAEAAEEAAGASPFFLLALLERALLRREGNRYTVHAAIAERYRSGLRDPQVALRRVISAWSQLAQRIEDMGSSRKTMHGYRQVDEEERNFRFVWQEILKDPQPGLLWPLVKVLRGYMDVRGRHREALAMFSAADAALHSCEDLELRGWVRESRALFLTLTGQLDEASSTVREAIGLLEEHGTPGEALGLAWNTAGYVHSLKYEDDQAMAALRRAGEVWAAQGDVEGEIQAFGNIAMLLADTGQTEEAMRKLDIAAQRYQQHGLHSGTALTLLRKASLMRESQLGTPSERLEVALASYRLGEEIGFSKTGMHAGREVAEALLELGRPQEAVPYLQRAAEWARIEANDQLERELLDRAEELSGPAGQLSS